MPKSTQSSQRNPQHILHELRESLNIEFVGLILFLIGSGFLLTLLRGIEPRLKALPWIVQMIGWTAPLFAVGLLIIGAVLMLHKYGGHWGIEAIIGGELLLLSLQIGAFAWNNSVVDWESRLDGANGGLVGWALGSLLVAGLGQWPALALIGVLGLLGLSLVLLYTPIIYYGIALFRQPSTLPSTPTLSIDSWFTRLTTFLTRLKPTTPEEPIAPTKSPANNFVTPAWTEMDDPEEVAEVDATLAQPPRKTGRKREHQPEMVAPQTQIVTPSGETRRAKNSMLVEKPAATAKQPRNAAPQTTARPKPMRNSGELPSIDLLEADVAVVREVSVRALQDLIEATLEDFNVPVKVVHVESGPTVTQFGVAPLYLERAGQKRKVRVNRIVNLADDLALALAVPAIRIEAPVPGRPYVGIEVPNTEKVVVTLRGILENKVFAQEGGHLPLALGRNTAGAPVVMDLTRAPHMLIAGATGSGKSACINTIITGLLMRHGPETLRFVMVDPKMVELSGYNGIPHLLGPVITDVTQVMGALTWLLVEMDDRYRRFQQVGVRNLDAYNTLARKGGKKEEDKLAPLPFIVLIIDELADLMMTAAEDIERQICRLAQMARATGIHLILATQRPSTDVVTGLIKANFPTRIGFAVTSQIDSRVILDTPGAERLLGRGDMLLMRPDMAKLLRVQGCYVTDTEINRLVEYWKQHSSAEPAMPPPWNTFLDRMEEEDELLLDAIEVLRGMKSCSTSMLQRKLRIGYPKAAQLMDQLEAKGIVGADLGGGQGREVLLKEEEGEELGAEEQGPGNKEQGIKGREQGSGEKGQGSRSKERKSAL